MTYASTLIANNVWSFMRTSSPGNYSCQKKYSPKPWRFLLDLFLVFDVLLDRSEGCPARCCDEV